MISLLTSINMNVRRDSTLRIFRRYRRPGFRKVTPFKPKPLPFRYVLLLSFVFFILSSTIGLWLVNQGIKPTLKAYAESQSINLATSHMNSAINEQIGNGLSLNDLTATIPSGDNTVLIFDTQKILTAGNQISDSIIKSINYMEEGKVLKPTIITDGEIEKVEYEPGQGIHFDVPFGRITDNALLGSLGPNIPVRFQAIGDVEINYDTVYKPGQINNAWFEIWLHIKVGIQIIIPFSTETIVVPRDVLLAAGEIRGEVPQFYGGGGNLMPSIEIPTDSEEKDKE